MGSRGMEIKMRSVASFILLAVLAALASAKPQNRQIEDYDDDLTLGFDCPEPNGLFADSEQCDLYYECNRGVATAKLCKDGYLFDDSKVNHESCKFPHGVQCGNRQFIQEPQEGIDERCPHANGLFDHDDPGICDKYISCDNGIAHELPCIPSLVFDNTIGACTRPEDRNVTGGAKECADAKPELKVVDGFQCPGHSIIGPQGIEQTHPVLPHPTSCRHFFTCYFGKDPNKLGCPEGQVFDTVSQQCKEAEQVPECACWYECLEDSDCPGKGECNADCTCPTNLETSFDE